MRRAASIAATGALACALLSPLAAAAAAPPAWIIDKAASSLRFTSSMGGEGFTGAFRRWDADIRFDPGNLPASSVTATIDVASGATGNADRDQALPTDAFLDAPAHPRASFVSHHFTALGGGRYQADGVLTLRGVAKPLSLPFTLAIQGSQAKMTGQVAINRLAFGVGQGEWKAVTTIPAAVTVSLAITARRAP
ncbi:MAG TPA: YceI family protein [Caulobacteraceae bacterium]|jgi:polyisoprenoid-binding protein YceI|nr:YceI family protein [Caulobacteraceae bacterium]